MRERQDANTGFTLVEMMIVVAVIGLLAAVAIPNLTKARERARGARFMGDLRAARSAFELYAIEHLAYPPDKNPGIIPAGMDEYLQKMNWTGETSLGGLWDWDYKQFGCVAGVSVFQPTADNAQMIEIDKTIDDGDLSTGSFRSRAAGYISIIE